LADKLKFAVDDINLLDEVNDEQFATAEVIAFSSGADLSGIAVELVT